MVRRLLTTPVPRQFLHGESMSLPLPPHVGQGVTWTYIAKLLFRICWTLPAPLHLGQVRTWVPGAAPEPPHTSHFSVRGTVISLSVPLAASSKEISSS